MNCRRFALLCLLPAWVLGDEKNVRTRDLGALNPVSYAQSNGTATPTKLRLPLVSGDRDLQVVSVATSGKIQYPASWRSTNYLQILDHDGWAQRTDDESIATRFEKYDYNGDTYYKVTSGDWGGYWLSYNNDGYLAAYRWTDARAWTTREGCLTVDGTAWETFLHNNYFWVDNVNSDPHPDQHIYCYLAHLVKYWGYDSICLTLN
ncbi:expressed unknown protein [Seminavis robusta]|uniref:Uncharacterized protein n=1 Tax=Seminavis robusta TaxID=568900 RepID=A0A9N8HBD8_9STRA|nr:expressed unknown protein [Seminavis robusta]|eukprot:Sro179_g078470.1 n/a (205) ;mRNA; r:36124-36832